jgi:hypothetical protein
MPSTLTRYTNRCSCVIRLDQQPASRYRRVAAHPLTERPTDGHFAEKRQTAEC